VPDGRPRDPEVRGKLAFGRQARPGTGTSAFGFGHDQLRQGLSPAARIRPAPVVHGHVNQSSQSFHIVASGGHCGRFFPIDHSLFPVYDQTNR
jgi:hypothetical protein